MRTPRPLTQEAIEQYPDALGGADLDAALSLRGSISADPGAAPVKRW